MGSTIQTLNEYLDVNRPQGFRAVPHYFRAGDYVTYHTSNERCYERRVDDLVTEYLSMATNELVGCKIKGVRHVLDTAGAFGVTVEGGRKKLGLFFFFGAAGAKEESQKLRYKELARFAEAELEFA